MGGRGSGSGFRAGAPTAAEAAATKAPEISEFYRARLARIDADIRDAQRMASLPLRPGDTAYYRRRVLNARRRVERLVAEYEDLERRARAEAESGAPF